jgi:hypothetical protein
MKVQEGGGGPASPPRNSEEFSPAKEPRSGAFGPNVSSMERFRFSAFPHKLGAAAPSATKYLAVSIFSDAERLSLKLKPVVGGRENAITLN